MKWTGRFEGYSRSALRKDLVSGLIVGIIAIPLGMAFAIAAGVKPEYGIYTTIVAGIAISLFGGSKFQIGGPTGAFIPILFAIVLQYGYENLLIAGFMAGVILVTMGLLRLGSLIAFIPRPVTIGFTAGIAVIIFSGQIASFLGLSDIKKHENFIPNMRELIVHADTFNDYSFITAAVCMLVVIVVPRKWPKAPASLIGLALSSVIASLFFSGKVATIGSTFGAIPNALPQFQMPDINWATITMLIQPALIIAMLGGIESLLSAVVADGMTGSRHNSNRELIGQGIANMAAPLFGGIPATGAIARTATNIKNGAVSPVSGIVHGVIVLLVLLLFAPMASEIPLASMAPILMAVAWNMSERRQFMQVLKARTSDSIVLLLTFGLTVFTNLTIAVEVGLAVAVLLFVKRTRDTMRMTKVLPDPNAKHRQVKAEMVSRTHDCPQITIYTIEGPLFFGTSGIFDKIIEDIADRKPGIVVLRMGKVPLMDTTGEDRMAALIRRLQSCGGVMLISGVQAQPLELLRKTGLYEQIDEMHMFERTGEAINCALTKLDTQVCRGCRQFAFSECAALSNCAAMESAGDVPAVGMDLHEKVKA